MEAEVTIWTRKKKKKMKLFRRLFQSRWCYITDKHSLCWDGRWRVRPKFWSHQDSSEPEWWWGWWLQWPHPGNRPIQQCSGKTLVYYIKNSKRSNFLLFPLCDFTLFCASTMWMNIWLSEYTVWTSSYQVLIIEQMHNSCCPFTHGDQVRRCPVESQQTQCCTLLHAVHSVSVGRSSRTVFISNLNTFLQLSGEVVQNQDSRLKP